MNDHRGNFQYFQSYSANFQFFGRHATLKLHCFLSLNLEWSLYVTLNQRLIYEIFYESGNWLFDFESINLLLSTVNVT